MLCKNKGQTRQGIPNVALLRGVLWNRSLFAFFETIHGKMPFQAWQAELRSLENAIFRQPNGIKWRGILSSSNSIRNFFWFTIVGSWFFSMKPCRSNDTFGFRGKNCNFLGKPMDTFYSDLLEKNFFGRSVFSITWFRQWRAHLVFCRSVGVLYKTWVACPSDYRFESRYRPCFQLIFRCSLTHNFSTAKHRVFWWVSFFLGKTIHFRM